MATTPDETVSVPPSITSNNLTHPPQTSRTNGATIISIPTASGKSSFELHHFFLISKLNSLADAIASFIWGSYLKSTGAHGAPVSYFRHVSC